MDRRPDDVRSQGGRRDVGDAMRAREPGRDAATGGPREAAPDHERARAPMPAGPAIGGGLPGAAGSPDIVGEEVLHAEPGPGAVLIEESELRERMEEESVDGRPPELRDQRRAQAFFWVTLAAVFLAVIGILWAYAGFLPALVAVVLAIFFIGLAAWPTWHAAVDRKMDQTRVKREVVDEHLHPEQARGHSGSGPAGPGVP